jgi:hypothetical protein
MDMDNLTPREEAYLKGFMDCSALTPRNNPYPVGSDLATEYDIGYNRSMEETGI